MCKCGHGPKQHCDCPGTYCDCGKSPCVLCDCKDFKRKKK